MFIQHVQDTTGAHSAESLHCVLDSLAQGIGPPLRGTHLWTGLGTYNNYTLRVRIRYCRMSRKSYVNMYMRCVCMYVRSMSHPRTITLTGAILF